MYEPSGRSMHMRGIEPGLNAYDEPDGGSAVRFVLREEDLFPVAIPAMPAKASKFVEDRNIGGIRRWISVTGTADERRTNAKRRREQTDYPFYVGQNAPAHCSRSAHE